MHQSSTIQLTMMLLLCDAVSSANRTRQDVRAHARTANLCGVELGYSYVRACVCLQGERKRGVMLMQPVVATTTTTSTTAMTTSPSTMGMAVGRFFAPLVWVDPLHVAVLFSCAFFCRRVLRVFFCLSRLFVCFRVRCTRW